MRVEITISLLLGLLSLFSLYLTICGELGYVVLAIIYGLCAFLLLKLNRLARYSSALIVAVHLITNLATVNLLYGTGRDTNAAAQVFLSGFDELQFFIEIGFSTTVMVVSLVLLLVPGTFKRFGGKNA
ncbi:hypothetical protein R50073_11550 [Maricurvus nonylphenolicus]